MKKIVRLVLALTITLVTTSVNADLKLSGTPAGGVGAGSVTGCSASGDSVTIQYAPGIMVRTKAEGKADGFTEVTGSGGKKVFTAPVPDGSTISLMPLAKDWDKSNTNINHFNVANAFATGVIQNGVATMTIHGYGADFNAAMVNAVVSVNGQPIAWGGIPNSPYTVYGPRGPLLTIPADCHQLTGEDIAAVKAVESLEK